jgi:predicted TIM-barrel enzyme
METIIEKVKSNRPHLGANSIKTYKSILKNIYDKCFDDKEYKMENFDKDEIILKHLTDMPYNKRKTVLASLSVLTENKKYNAQMLKDISSYNENEMKQEKTP